MMMKTLPDWTLKSQHIENIDVEIYFSLPEAFYTGDSNSIHQLQDAIFHEKNTLPDFARAQPFRASTREILGKEILLGQFYLHILDKAFRHRKNFRDISSIFWLRLEILDVSGECLVSFPWYDHFDTMHAYFEQLNANICGEVFSDLDQGWQLEVFADENFFYFREYNWEQPEEKEWCNMKILKTELLLKNREVTERAVPIIACLASHLGDDVWSVYRKEALLGWRARAIRFIRAFKRNTSL